MFRIGESENCQDHDQCSDQNFDYWSQNLIEEGNELML